MRPRYRFEFPSLLHERLMGVSLRGDFCKVCPVTDRMRMGCNFSFSSPMLFPSSLFLLSFLFFFFFFFNCLGINDSPGEDCANGTGWCLSRAMPVIRGGLASVPSAFSWYQNN